MKKILIKNGLIVNADHCVNNNILIENGKICVIGNIYSEDATIIDAKDCYIFPGGIDPHVHFNLNTEAGFTSDSFYDGSRAAISGGTTTIIDFVTPSRGESIVAAVEKREKDAAACLIDHKLHVSPVEFTEYTAKELEKIIEMGYKSFKIYLAYKKNIGLSDKDLFAAMSLAAKKDVTVCLHCENGDVIEYLQNKFIEQNCYLPKYHALSRPDVLEAEAIHRATCFAEITGCRLYIVHVSSKRALLEILNAREKGVEIFAETCPQYLWLNNSVYEQSFEESSKYVISPPIRTEMDNKFLLNALSENIIDTLASDHCPFNKSQKEFGKTNFTKIPSGAGGVEHRLALLFNYAVNTQNIDLQQFVKLTSWNAAKIFNLSDRKGAIKKGYDADIVVWNPKLEKTITAQNHVSKCDEDIFENFKLKGLPQTVISKGKILFENGQQVSTV